MCVVIVTVMPQRNTVFSRIFHFEGASWQHWETLPLVFTEYTITESTINQVSHSGADPFTFVVQLNIK